MFSRRKPRSGFRMPINYFWATVLFKRDKRKLCSVSRKLSVFWLLLFADSSKNIAYKNPSVSNTVCEVGDNDMTV